MNQRHCWYKNDDEVWVPGVLHQWSVDHEEFETGPGHFPVGIVEDHKTGTCHSVYVENISFGSAPPE